MQVEPDLSNAAPVPRRRPGHRRPGARCRGWPQYTTQGGDFIRDVLDMMGAEVVLDRAGLTVSGGGSISGIDVDLHDSSELTPVVAALCAAGRLAQRHPRGRRTSAGTRPTGSRRCAPSSPGSAAQVDETDDGLRDHPAPAARRHLPHLRRPPDGHGRRGARAGACPASSSRTSAPSPRPCPSSPGCGTRCSATGSRRAPDGAGDGLVRRVDDVRIRPNRRGTRPRSKDRPAHEDAVPGRVTGVDRGRYTTLVGDGDDRARRSSPCGPASSAARASSSATTSTSSATPPAPTAASPASCGWHPAQHGAATHRRRHRPGRARARGQRRPARRRLRAGQPRAAAPADRPLPGRRVRRRDGAPAGAHQGRPDRPRHPSSSSTPRCRCVTWSPRGTTAAPTASTRCARRSPAG